MESFFQASLCNCINCVHCDNDFFIFISFPQFIYDLFHISLTILPVVVYFPRRGAFPDSSGKEPPYCLFLGLFVNFSVYQDKEHHSTEDNEFPEYFHCEKKTSP